MRHVQLSSLPWKESKSPTGKFHSRVCNVSLALGGAANTGTWGGGHPFDVQLRRVPPGAAVCPFHGHLAQWEMFVVRRGTASVRTSEGVFPVRTGEVFYHPPGAPHQLINSGAEELEVLIIADNPPLDSCFYPDSNKRSLRPPGKFFRIEEVHYYDGEDALPETPEPFVASPAPGPRAAAPFAERRVHPDDLRWDAWESPGGKFQGEAKELSIALGAKRNTPTGMGGHPFELELGRLRPGKSGAPFHWHAAEWEMFMILSGTALVRANEGTRVLGAGDVVLHPPGEAHQITNQSTSEDLLYYLIADNAPVDYCYYPDSDKWCFREPRKFFRATDVGLWEAEE